jgi:hypothetical protein
MAANKHPNRALVVEAYRSGLSFRETGDNFGLSNTSVRNILRKDAPHIMRPTGRCMGTKVPFSVAIPDLTGSILEELFTFNPDDGVFRHKTWRGPRCGGPGSEAGCVMTTGYIAIGLPGKLVLAHRLAWLWMTGKWPAHEIDHINGDRSDNRWCNLREATRVQNSRNGGIRSTNRTGRIGLSFDKVRSKYKAAIMVAGKTVFQKRYDTFDEAVAARSAKEKELFGDYSPGHHIGVQNPA